ncbi:MAG TPA: serine protease [Steroidobacteraceae bacterium]|nr:serine protease [Steroidobacteraceae bacterium]
MPANIAVAIYLPKQVREFRSVFHSAGGFQTTDSVQLGNTFEEAALASAHHFFATTFMYEVTGTPGYGLLIAMHPEVKPEDQQLVATAHYAVYDAAGTSVLKGDSVVRWAPGMGVHNSDVLGGLMEQVINRTLTDIVAKLRPTADKFPTGEKSQLSVSLLVDKDHPALSGTGFFVNSTGQVLTAAHVVHECAVVEVRHGGNSVPATVAASSALLDLAVLDTHASNEHFLPLRHAGRLELGENVANIGFPLQSLMTDAPTVTRGTLSSRAGLSGSLGQFQFSAPIQPGASGGPVIGARGDVVGVAVGSLNAAELLKQGVLPQNVNFALEAQYIQKFLQNKSVVFVEGPEDPHTSPEVPIDNVLPAVVGVKCYQ